MSNIKHFILVFYERQDWDNVSPVYKARWDAPIDLGQWNRTQYRLVKQQIEQLNAFYPDASVHVMTNMNSLPFRGVYFHKVDSGSTHVMKLWAYGLLDEPAMYLDADILFLRRFAPDHIATSNAFKLYSLYDEAKNYFKPEILKVILSKPLPVELPVPMYQAPVVWIATPSSKLREDLLELNFAYFNNREQILAVGRSCDSDELPVSLYAKMHNMEMPPCPQVAINRRNVASLVNANAAGVQSVHYAGTKQKGLCLEECQALRSKLHLYL